MSTFNQKYVQNPSGRAFIISTLLTLLFFFIALLIPLAPYESGAWYSFLYMDPSITEADRTNWLLVVIESLLLWLFYFFGLLSLGSYAEINNRLPSWGEVIVAALATITASYFLPLISVGSVQVTDGGSFKHFNDDMRLAVFIASLVGIILITLYMIYSEDPSNE